MKSKKQFVAITLTSSLSVNSYYLKLTRDVGKILAKEGFGVIYGGTDYGMMSELANSFLRNGGDKLIGVLAKDLMKVTKAYRAHPNLTKKYILPTIEDRKKKIMELADAYLILPGGFGTFEEIGSIVGGKVNKLFNKPIAILNKKKFYNSLFDFFSHIYQDKFTKINYKNVILVSTDMSKIVNYFKNYQEDEVDDKFS